MKRFITVVGASFFVGALQAQPQAGVITATSVGPVKLGMTVAQARSALPGVTFSRTTGGDGEALIAVKRGENLMMTLYTGDAKPTAPIDDRAVIAFVEARDAGYRTSAGVNPTMRLQEVERRYGKLDEISLSEIEAREYATFANHPAGISFRVRTDSVLAGVYPANQTRTERYVPSAYVFGISISARRKRAPTFASAYTDVKAQCVNPAPANNEAQHSSLFCKGPGNYRLHIFDSAEALEISAQTVDGQSSTRLATQSLTWDQQPRKIEWRLADGKPFAVILRVFKYSGKGQYPRQEKPIGEVLLVKGLPGYEHIDAEVDVKTTKNANEKARNLADGNYDKVSVLLRRGYASLANRDAVTAIVEATQAIEADSQSAAAYLLRGSAYSTKGHAIDSALSDLDQAIKLNPSFAQAYFHRGLVRQRARTAGLEYAGLPAAALGDFTEAVRLRPEWAPPYFRRGLLHQERGEHQQAIDDFTKAIALRMDPGMAYDARGQAFAAQKQYDLAISDFSQVISLEPRNLYVYGRRAAAYCAARRKDLAAVDEKRVVALGGKLFDDELCGAGTGSQPPPEQASVEKPLPRFEDYPAPEKLIGKPVNPIISSPRARLYRTSIRNDVKAGPNFAGRYTIASWGCGSTCVGFAVVDARTGRVVFHPKVLRIAQVPYQAEDVLQFRPDSRLLIIAGEILSIDPEEAIDRGGMGRFYYEWRGNRFTLIKTADIRREESAPPLRANRAQRRPAGLDSLCIGTDNPYECAQAIERHQLSKPQIARVVVRAPGGLRLRLLNGKIQNVQNRGKENSARWFSFRDYLGGIGYFLLHRQLYEGEDYLLIHAGSGKQFTLQERPVISPDGLRIITASAGLSGMSSGNAVQIWRVQPRGLVLEFALSPEDWEPWSPRWLDNRTIRLGQRAPLMGESRAFSKSVDLVRLQGQWKLGKAAPGPN